MSCKEKNYICCSKNNYQKGGNSGKDPIHFIPTEDSILFTVYNQGLWQIKLSCAIKLALYLMYIHIVYIR